MATTSRSARLGHIRQPVTSTPGLGGSSGHTGQLQPEAHSSYFIVIEYNRSQEQTLPGPMDYHHHICNDMIKVHEIIFMQD